MFFRIFFFSCFYHFCRQSLGEFGLFGPWAACDVLCVKRKKGCDAYCVISSNWPRGAKERLFEISRKNLSGYFESEITRKNLSGYFEFEITRKNLFGDLEMGAPGERVGMRAHVRASALARERGSA